MKKSKSLYHGHRFPAGVISCAVRWYFRFQLSLRDIEELLFERGVTVTYETIRCWCDKFGKGFAHRVKAARRKPGSTWHLDEMFGRTLPAVACGGRAWCRTRHPGTKAARQGRRQTLLQACAALESNAAQDCHGSTAQLSGGKSRDPGVGEREARVRQSCSPAEQSCREQPPTDPRTRALHAWLSRP